MIFRFIELVDADIQIEAHEKKYILTFLFEIIEEFSKALNHLKDYVVVNHNSMDQTPYKVATRILISSQSNKPLFFELLIAHIEWLAQGRP